MSPQDTSAPRRGDVRGTIIEAAARLLREQGSRAVTTRAVAQEAGVQAPALYRLFGDKDGLLDAVAEHVMATYVATKHAAAVNEGLGDPLADLRAGWQLHVDFGLANPDLYLLLNTAVREQRSAATVAGIEVLRMRVHRLATSGLLRVDERRAVEMIHAAGTGAVLAMLALPADIRDLGMADAMFDAVAAAILSDTPVATNSDTVTVAVACASVVDKLPTLSSAEHALMAEWLGRAITSLQTGSEPEGE
jgi:AcrR family transcriptional regulator